MDIPQLDLNMCTTDCIGIYLERFPQMKLRINSIEVPFCFRFRKGSNQEQWKKQLLYESGQEWTSRVRIINFNMYQTTDGLEMVNGNAIFMR